jgi:hypothetical protein
LALRLRWMTSFVVVTVECQKRTSTSEYQLSTADYGFPAVLDRFDLNGVFVRFLAVLCRGMKCSSSPSSNARSITITSEVACRSMLVVILIVTFAVVQASNLPFPAIRQKAFRPKAYVKIDAGALHRRTQSVKWERDEFTRWDSKLHL